MDPYIDDIFNLKEQMYPCINEILNFLKMHPSINRILN